MSTPENKRTKTLGDRQAVNSVPEGLQWLASQTVASEASPDTVVSDQGKLTAEKVEFARARKATIKAVVGLILVTGVGAGLVATGVVRPGELLKGKNSRKTSDQPDTRAKRLHTYKIVSKEEEALLDRLSKSPYKITGDLSLPVDKRYIIVAQTEEKNPDVSVSDAWKKVLSSPYTGEDCGVEVELIVQKDPEGAKQAVEFLLQQMGTFKKAEEGFAIRMGLLAINLNPNDPRVKDRAYSNLVFLDYKWAYESEQAARKESSNTNESQQPVAKPTENLHSEYVLSAPSETPTDPEKLKEDLRNRKDLKPGKISYGFTLIGIVEYARVLAARAAIVSSVDQIVGTGGMYEVTEVTDLGFSFNGLPVRYLKVKIISGQKMPEGVLWVVSATDMQKSDKFLGWRVAAAVTG